MRRDTTEFRNRFQKWKNGEQVYENGLVSASYQDGKENESEFPFGDQWLKEVTVYPTTLSLQTHYPIVSRYLPGHSVLLGNNENTGDHFIISKRPNNPGYNFVTNNCSDDTRKALEAATGNMIRPFLFTTPGDVQDFFRQQYPDFKERKSRNGVKTLTANVSPIEFSRAKEIADSLSDINREKRRQDLKRWHQEALRRRVSNKDSLYRDGKEVNNTSGVSQTSYLKSLYNTVSNALDFIPIVGAANRFIRNEKNDALFNLASDAIMPTVPNLIVKGAYHGNERLKKSLAHGAWSAQFSSTVPEAFDTFLQNTKRYYNDKPIQIISGPDPGLGFLLNDHQQKDFMESLGYRKTTDEDGIKMIEKATNALTRHRLGRKPNIYQIGEDEIPRDSVIPIEADSVPDGFRYSAKDLLYNANEHPTVFYKSKNQQNPKYYYRDIDLNDYGTYLESKGTSYDGLQILSSIYDFFGNPFIQKSGIKELKGFKHGKESGIHIKPSHRGRLTALKKRTGKSEAELYKNGSAAVRKMITFARSSRKWHKK